MITEDTYSKWICGNLLITADSKVYLKNNKPAREILCGGSFGYYVNRRFRTKKWIKENCSNHKKLISQIIVVPF